MTNNYTNFPDEDYRMIGTAEPGYADLEYTDDEWLIGNDQVFDLIAWQNDEPTLWHDEVAAYEQQ